MRSIMMLAALAVSSCEPAYAAPPPPGSPDAEMMEPYSGWITSQHSRDGGWCCDWGDGRPVTAEIRRGTDGDEHWFVHVTPDHFPALPDEWVEIPDYKLVHVRAEDGVHGTPPPFPMIWMSISGNYPYCFWPGAQD